MESSYGNEPGEERGMLFCSVGVEQRSQICRTHMDEEEHTEKDF